MLTMANLVWPWEKITNFRLKLVDLFGVQAIPKDICLASELVSAINFATNPSFLGGLDPKESTLDTDDKDNIQLLDP